MERERIELQKSLANDISRGMEQVKQVKVSCSEEERVVERMLSSYEEALFILTGCGGPGGQCESVTSQSNPPGECQSVITSLSNPPASLPPARKDESRSALKRRRRAIKKRLMVFEQKKEKRLMASGEKTMKEQLMMDIVGGSMGRNLS